MSKIIAWHILLLFDCKVMLKSYMKMIGRMGVIWLKDLPVLAPSDINSKGMHALLIGYYPYQTKLQSFK